MIKSQCRVAAFSHGMRRAHFAQNAFIGVVYRGLKILEGVFGVVGIKKESSESAIVDCLKKSSFMSQIRLILIDSSFLYNVSLDLSLLYRYIGIPLAAIQSKPFRSYNNESRIYFGINSRLKIKGKKIYVEYRGIEKSLLASSLKTFSDETGTICAIKTARAIASAYNRHLQATKRIN